MISSTLPDDLLLVMGDFIARVGCGDDTDPLWLRVKGMFGVGHLNEKGEHLLTFCAVNELCVMNTMFAKKRIYQYTWQHPETKVWHCIDYVLMCHSQRHYCTDAIWYFTQLNVGLIISCSEASSSFRKRTSCRQKRFNVSPLHNTEFVQKFVGCVANLLEGVWDEDVDSQTQWFLI